MKHLSSFILVTPNCIGYLSEGIRLTTLPNIITHAILCNNFKVKLSRCGGKYILMKATY